MFLISSCTTVSPWAWHINSHVDECNKIEKSTHKSEIPDFFKEGSKKCTLEKSIFNKWCCQIGCVRAQERKQIYTYHPAHTQVQVNQRHQH